MQCAWTVLLKFNKFSLKQSIVSYRTTLYPGLGSEIYRLKIVSRFGD
jgi:hypothetical protein